MARNKGGGRQDVAVTQAIFSGITAATGPGLFIGTMAPQDNDGDYLLMQFQSADQDATLGVYSRLTADAEWALVDTIILTADAPQIISYFEAPFWAFRVESVTAGGSVSAWVRY